ncbi:Mps one binder kinase activator-like 2A [Caligus rogercresseyi]|uniref:Mps one binder kinase activator-like 2A n=1 Tax=Caligus rogercresseyi TaxID=217165 RepID=A0A7T8JVR2_CALRO|nr:Mps one binder kinase activator-like 2A [Caligus rogercresseyi]
MDSFFEKLRFGNEPKTALRQKNFKVGSARFSLHQAVFDSLTEGVDLEALISCQRMRPSRLAGQPCCDFYNKMEVRDEEAEVKIYNINSILI